MDSPDECHVEWLHKPDILRAEILFEGKWYEGGLDIVELDEED